MINIAAVTAFRGCLSKCGDGNKEEASSQVPRQSLTAGGKRRGIQRFLCLEGPFSLFLNNTSQCLLFFEQNTNLGPMDDVFISHPNETRMMVVLDEEAEVKRPTSFWRRSWEGCRILSPDPLVTSDATWQVVWVPHFTLNKQVGSDD